MRKTSNHESRITNHGLPRARGFTLVEMIVVIAITGIIAAVVAVFIRRPVEGYVDAVRRAELTDIADTALRRMTRDMRTALPNSIRATASGNVQYIEYLQTSGGGRYRVEKKSDGTGAPVDFTAAITDFDVIGMMPALASGDSIVIYNLTADETLAIANGYEGDNRSAYSSNTPTTITIASKQFPFESPGKRFQVVQYPVTYACDPTLTGGTGQLRRYWGYTPQRTPQPTPPAAGSNALLATHVSECSFAYAPSAVSARTGVVRLFLKITDSGESVQLFQQVHVNNVP